MRKNIALLPILLLLLGTVPYTVYAQDKEKLVTFEQSGYILDDAGTPLPGVLLKAGKTGAVDITGQSGEFTINTAAIDHVGINEEGYNSLSVSVWNGIIERDTIILQRTNYFSEESNVEFPFGSINMNRSTGSVFKVSGDQLRKHPSGQVLEALTGLIPGLMIRQTSSRPGYEGYNLMYHGKPVEVLIDGFPQQLHLSLREIEEVIMMKGAASTAMMGDLGANGILYVKTLRGQAGPRQLKFEYEPGYGIPTAMGEYMNAHDYASTINQSLVNDGLQSIYTDDALSAYLNGADPVRYPDVNYRDEFLRSNMNRQQFNAQFSGGTGNSKYFTNVAYGDFKGLEKLDEKRNGQDFIFRANLDLDIAENAKLDASLVGSFQKMRQPYLTTANFFDGMSSYPFNAFPLMLGDSIYITS